jgi:hypothetical protein
MPKDRSQRRGMSKEAQHERKETLIDRNADEALRGFVRVLARDAARELFAKSGEMHAGEDDDREGQR